VGGDGEFGRFEWKSESSCAHSPMVRFNLATINRLHIFKCTTRLHPRLADFDLAEPRCRSIGSGWPRFSIWKRSWCRQSPATARSSVAPGGVVGGIAGQDTEALEAVGPGSRSGSVGRPP